LNVYYIPLREKIVNIVNQGTNGRYSFYFEDLTTGAWVGINEKEKYFPASVNKISTASAVLKKIQDTELKLNDEVLILDEDYNSNFGTELVVGRRYTIKELLDHLIKKSDNTANNALKRIVSLNRLIETSMSMGLDFSTYFKSSDSDQEISLSSAKSFGNVFRSLYFSTYLTRAHSQYLLQIMTDTEYNTGIPAGVPSDVIVAHKIGISESNNNANHDCGIVFAEIPYIICIFSDQSSYEEANMLISQISKVVYDYVHNEI